jgi:uncharacterized membrane protein YqgA involved in biofilm formation
MRGTLLNAASVGIGAGAGLLLGTALPDSYRQVAMNGIGLVTLGVGIKMFLQVRNPLVVAGAVVLGGILGLALGIHSAIEGLSLWAQSQFSHNGDGSFATGMITSFVLFCVGPMTLLGCLEDALEHKIDLLSLKSTLDGVSAVFLAAALGTGVLFTAVLVLIFQGAITLLARHLKPLIAEEAALAELTATGGAILVGTGIGLLGLKDLQMANYLPCIFIAPGMVLVSHSVKRRR